MVPIFDPSIWKAKTEGSLWVWSQAGLSIVNSRPARATKDSLSVRFPEHTRACAHTHTNTPILDEMVRCCKGSPLIRLNLLACHLRFSSTIYGVCQHSVQSKYQLQLICTQLLSTTGRCGDKIPPTFTFLAPIKVFVACGRTDFIFNCNRGKWCHWSQCLINYCFRDTI